jgi:SAM-dependent methyltransferase
MTDHLDHVQANQVLENYIDNGDPDYATTYDVNDDSALSFALFGLDRDVRAWVTPDWDKPVLDLGPGNKYIPGTKRLDWPQYDWEPAMARRFVDGHSAKVAELPVNGILPYPAGSVGGIFCVNLLEHLWDPRPLIFEMARVLAPTCPINIFVPHADSIMYKQDLDHKKPFVLDTFKNLLVPHKYYEKGHSDGHGLEVGACFKFAVKEGNEACVIQLVKTN